MASIKSLAERNPMAVTAIVLFPLLLVASRSYFQKDFEKAALLLLVYWSFLSVFVGWISWQISGWEVYLASRWQKMPFEKWQYFFLWLLYFATTLVTTAILFSVSPLQVVAQSFIQGFPVNGQEIFMCLYIDIVTMLLLCWYSAVLGGVFSAPLPPTLIKKP